MKFLDPESVLREFGLYGALDVADFGAGAGHISLVAAKRLEDGRLFAVDIEKDMLRRLVSEAGHSGLRNLHSVWGDVASHKGVPLADETLDRVLVISTLHAAHDRDALIKEAHRLLRPEGLVLLVDWHTDADFGPHEHHRVAPDVALSLFRRHGFEKERDVNAGDFHYGMILRKK